MIAEGDLITTNYCGRWPETFRVVEVRRDCQCGRWSNWQSTLVRGRQRLPHLHVVALDERGERCWWNGMIERDGRLVSTQRLWHRDNDEDEYQRIHPEILLVEKATQGSLF